MLKREWGAESNGKVPHLFIPSKTATLVPEFVVEDLPLGRTAAFMPEFAVKDLPWTKHTEDDEYISRRLLMGFHCNYRNNIMYPKKSLHTPECTGTFC